MEFAIVCSQIYKSRAFFFYKRNNCIVIVPFVQTTYNKNGWRSHAIKSIPACIYIGSLGVIYILYTTHTGYFFQAVFNTLKTTQTFT